MKLIVLDDFPPWTTYLLGLIVLCGFLLALVMSIHSWRNWKGDEPRSWINRQLWFLTTGGALAVWFLAASMYFRFHAIRIDSRHMDLVYFWPRPVVTLGVREPIDVELLPAHRTCGHLVVTTPHETFRSVNFKKCDGAEQLFAYMQTLKKDRWH